MDDEVEEGSVGAYDNMERSDIRPGFYSGRASEEDDAEQDGTRGKRGDAADRAKNALRSGENAAAKKIAEKSLNAATGGVAGTALKAADKAGVDTSNLAGTAVKGAKVAGKVKKALPLLIIVAVIIALWAVFSFVGQWLFPFGFKARMSEEWNSTKTSTAARTDAMMNEQMECETDENFAESVYNDMGFSKQQKESFENAGLGYEQDGCSTVITFKDSDGNKKIVTSDKTISKYMNNGQAIADGGDAVSDSGAEGVSEDEAKAAILARFDIAADTDQVMTFSEALNNTTFKQAYLTATKWWRGDSSGWFTDMTETVMERLGISRNNYADFELTGDDETDKEAFLEIAKSKPAAAEGSEIGDKSLKERVTEVAKASAEPNCGTSSAFTDIEGVITADQTARQVSAGSLWLEAIDKTMAGEGNGAPLSVANNIIVESGGASTEGVTHLFGSGVLNQANELVQKVSAQAHGDDNSIVSSGNLDNEAYRGCIYEGNTNRAGGIDGAIVSIGSIFDRASQWLSSAVNSLKNIFRIIGLNDGQIINSDTAGLSNIADSALSATADAYEEMKNQSYFNGDDTALIGEAMVTASERIYNEKAKSAGQVVGDETALLATYRAQQDLIAEEAEYDRATKSPLDITSKNTFLGNITYSLIPFATSSSSTSLTSTVSNIGSLLSNSLSSLLPTSQAISEAQVARGDCVLSNNIGAVSNPHCNNYYNSDLTLATTTPRALLQEVANLRYDEKGYTYRAKYNDCSSGTCILRTVSKDDPSYGEGPLNEAEGNACVSEYAKTASGQDILSQPIAWSYSRYTNFEYEGYASGWPNRNSSGSVNAYPAGSVAAKETRNGSAKTTSSSSSKINLGTYGSTPGKVSYHYAGYDEPHTRNFFGDYSGFISEANSGDSLDWVALGNSITMQNPFRDWDENGSQIDGWKGYYGAAASEPSKDYVHLTANTLAEKVGNVNVLAYRYKNWEGEADGSRSAVLSELDPILSEGVDLVTIALGENFSEEFTEAGVIKDNTDLINYVKQKAPNAQIVLIADWYEPKGGAPHNSISNAEHQAAQNTGSGFVDLRDVEGNDGYFMTTASDKTATDENGNKWEVVSWAVLWHPSDKGMQLEADRLVEVLLGGGQTSSYNFSGNENAQNNVNPEQCVLDIKMDSSGQPVINKNGALGVFLLTSGQRSSEWGVADQNNIDIISKSDFTKGRIHPCLVDSDECKSSTYVDLGWSSFTGEEDENGNVVLNVLGKLLSKISSEGTDADTLKKATVSSANMSRWIGGSAYVYYSGNADAFGSMNTGFYDDSRFRDATRGGDYFWNEMKYYQAYSELLEWMESAGIINTSSATVAVNDYYDENPLDNSYEGIIARYSGLSKERVAAVLDLLEYVAFLNNYDATALYPLPVSEPEKLRYDNSEIIATAEQVIQNSSIIYADLRTRTLVA